MSTRRQQVQLNRSDTAGEVSTFRMIQGPGAVFLLTGQLADKPTRSQSSRGLDNSRTGQLADNQFLKKHGLTILYLYIKPNSNPIEYWQRINSVICLK